MRWLYARATSAPVRDSPARMLSASDGLNSSGEAASIRPNFAWKCHARRVRKVSSASASTGWAAETEAPAAVKADADEATIEATSASTSIVPPRSGASATRSPESDPDSGGAKAEPGSVSACGARGSGPAITDSSRARSPTLRAIGPPTEVVSHWL